MTPVFPVTLTVPFPFVWLHGKERDGASKIPLVMVSGNDELIYKACWKQSKIGFACIFIPESAILLVLHGLFLIKVLKGLDNYLKKDCCWMKISWKSTEVTRVGHLKLKLFNFVKDHVSLWTKM